MACSSRAGRIWTRCPPSLWATAIEQARSRATRWRATRPEILSRTICPAPSGAGTLGTRPAQRAGALASVLVPSLGASLSLYRVMVRRLGLLIGAVNPARLISGPPQRAEAVKEGTLWGVALTGEHGVASWEWAWRDCTGQGVGGVASPLVRWSAQCGPLARRRKSIQTLQTGARHDAAAPS